MSHIAITKVKIKNPNERLLKKAVEQLAKELKGELVSEIIDYSKKITKVPLGIKTPLIHRGVGIIVRKGEVQLEGDFWGYEEEKDKLNNLLTQIYTSLAIQKSLHKLGYTVNQQKKGNHVFLYARCK